MRIMLNDSLHFLNRWVVSKIKTGGWAETDGRIESGDVIEAVDEVECKGSSLETITAMLQGVEGSACSVSLVKPSGERITVEGIRQKCV